MHSNMLTEIGLRTYIAGSRYDVRSTNGDAHVKSELERIFSDFNLQPREVMMAHQVHGTQVVNTSQVAGEDYLLGQKYADTDGLITNKPGVALVIKFADCTPIVLYDPVQKVQASIHAGWRGTRDGISLVAIKKMETDFGSKREDIIAYVGPTIDQFNYEVGSEVYEAYKKFSNRNKFFYPLGDKYHFNLNDANVSMLFNAGIKMRHIERATVSTFNDDRLHSARQEGENYGLNCMVTMIEE